MIGSVVGVRGGLLAQCPEVIPSPLQADAVAAVRVVQIDEILGERGVVERQMLGMQQLDEPSGMMNDLSGVVGGQHGGESAVDAGLIGIAGGEHADGGAETGARLVHGLGVQRTLVEGVQRQCGVRRPLLDGGLAVVVLGLFRFG